MGRERKGCNTSRAIFQEECSRKNSRLREPTSNDIGKREKAGGILEIIRRDKAEVTLDRNSGYELAARNEGG